LSNFLLSRLHGVPAQLRHLARALGLVWRACPGLTAAWGLLLLVQGALPVATVYLTRPVVNGLVAAIRSGGNWGPLLLPAALMGVVLLIGELIRGSLRWIRTAQGDLVQDHIMSLIHRKSIAADLSFYESPDFYDHLHRARAEASYRPAALLETFGAVIQNGITLIAMLAVIASFGVWLPAALMLSALPAFAVVIRYAAMQHEFRMRTTSIERRAWYHDWLLTTGESAPEIRLFALGNYFYNGYRNLRARLRDERLALARGQSLAELSASASSLGVTAAALIWAVWKTLHGLLSPGDLALFYQAFQQGSGLARTLLENLGQLYQNSLFLGNLFEFLALEPQVVSPEQPIPAPLRVGEGIVFSNVVFRYPDAPRLALDNFSVRIQAGRIVAIVGPNGAGKSTLAKLLCRFYDPQAGSISIDGVDLRNFSLAELRRCITVLFQQPVHYNATVRENIAFGDLSRDFTNGAVQTAAETADAGTFIRRLPDGYENLLGHWFEKGTELSVGEWQRIALARAFLRQAPIIVLDEPTAAMDPWAEAEWLSRFRELAAGRIAIIITHRFTTAMLADEIHVIDEGRVIESGSHAELVGRAGRYAQWWSSQNIE
jgi:ATP-binding cassette subfamily B protein